MLQRKGNLLPLRNSHMMKIDIHQSPYSKYEHYLSYYWQTVLRKSEVPAWRTAHSLVIIVYVWIENLL